MIAHTFCLCLFLTSIFHPAIVEKHLLKKISFFPAESDPGIARPLHLFPLPVLNASKLTMTWLLVLLCWWLKENKAVPTLPMFQVVQSMQRGKGLGRNKGRIKAVRKTFEKKTPATTQMKRGIPTNKNYQAYFFRNLQMTAFCLLSLVNDESG